MPRKCGHSNCKKRPVYAREGSKVPEFCREHSKKGMVNVLSKDCCIPQIGCIKPMFGVEGSKKPEFRRQLVKPGMGGLSFGNRSGVKDRRGGRVGLGGSALGGAGRSVVTGKKRGSLSAQSKRTGHSPGAPNERDKRVRQTPNRAAAETPQVAPAEAAAAAAPAAGAAAAAPAAAAAAPAAAAAAAPTAAAAAPAPAAAAAPATTAPAAPAPATAPTAPTASPAPAPAPAPGPASGDQGTPTAPQTFGTDAALKTGERVELPSKAEATEAEGEQGQTHESRLEEDAGAESEITSEAHALAKTSPVVSPPGRSEPREEGTIRPTNVT